MSGRGRRLSKANKLWVHLGTLDSCRKHLATRHREVTSAVKVVELQAMASRSARSRGPMKPVIPHMQQE
jgi:hypothetical protein